MDFQNPASDLLDLEASRCVKYYFSEQPDKKLLHIVVEVITASDKDESSDSDVSYEETSDEEDEGDSDEDLKSDADADEDNDEERGN